MTTRFYYDGRYQIITDAVEGMEVVMQSTLFRRRVLEKPFFYMSTNRENTHVTGKKLLYLMDYNQIRCQVETYRPWWRWAPSVAKYKGGKDIHLNSRKLRRSVHSVRGSIMHEYVHLLDNFLSRYYLGHGTDSPKGKEHTAPYWLGSLMHEVSVELDRKLLSD